MSITKYIECATRGYIEAALWTGLLYVNDDDPVELDTYAGSVDLPASIVASAKEDVNDFVRDHWADVEALDPGQVGHDFSLTRNHHGAGFWDRGLGELGDRLTAASHAYGEANLTGYGLTDDEVDSFEWS